MTIEGLHIQRRAYGELTRRIEPVDSSLRTRPAKCARCSGATRRASFDQAVVVERRQPNPLKDWDRRTKGLGSKCGGGAHAGRDLNSPIEKNTPMPSTSDWRLVNS